MPTNVRATQPQGATFIELFFDLVFVFAVTQVTDFLIHHLDAVGLLRALLLFWLVWWAWTQFTWTLNAADTEHPRVQLLTMAAAATAFLMAVAIPAAFDLGGVVFGVTYALVRMIGIAGQWWVSANDAEWRAAVRKWTALSVAGLIVVVIAGALEPTVRTVGFALAAGLDLFAAWQSGDGEWRLFPAHFAERHGLFVIIALGESLIAAGVTASGQPRTPALAAVVVAAVVCVCALWWTYFARAKDALEASLTAVDSPRRAALARDVYSFLHFPIICGVIGVAVGVHEAVAHPSEPFATAGSAALLGGVALFVGCTGLALARAHHGRPLIRGVAVVVLAGAHPLLVSWSPAAGLGTVAVLLVVLAVVEQMTPGVPGSFTAAAEDGA